MTVYQGTSFTPELTATGFALFRAGVKVSAGTVRDLAASLRRRHDGQGTRWRLLGRVARAVLVIAFLRTNQAAHRAASADLVRGPSLDAAPVRGRPCKADGPAHRCQPADAVRYTSVDTAT